MHVRSASLAALAAASVAHAAMDPGDGFVLRLFADTATTGAVCLDGSPAGYYIRPSSNPGNSTFLIELEGGGWCSSVRDCASRALTNIGSSRGWPATGSPGMDGGSHGLFSSNCTLNPDFCNATMAHFNYCDGGSFASYLAAPVVYNNTPLFFRGRTILDESLRQLLLYEGLAQAEHVMLKGCSAGGLATILHVDYVAETLRASVPSLLSVVGVPDAGYFLDHTDVFGQPFYTPVYQWVASFMNVTQAGSVNDGCLAAYSAAESWRCFFAQYTLPFVKTPMFVAQDLDDSWQLNNIYRLPCSPAASKPGNCNATEIAWMGTYRTDTLAGLAPVINSSGLHGGFITTCVQHCHSNIDFCFDKAVVAGQTMVQTLGVWYNKTVRGIAPPPGVATLVVDGVYGTNPTCTSSCSPF